MNQEDIQERFGYIAEAIDFFRGRPELVIRIKREYWTTLIATLKYFARLVSMKREEQDIQAEKAENPDFMDQHTIQRAGIQQEWVLVTEPYAASSLHDTKRVCCNCGVPHRDDKPYYRLKQRQIYLCLSCYEDFKDNGFHTVRPKVYNYLRFLIDVDY